MIGFLTLDRDLRITQWSEALVSLTGKTEKEVIGQNLFDLFPELRERGIEVALQHALESGAPVTLSHRLHHSILPSADGSDLPQRGEIYPLFRDHDVIGLLITIQDVSDRLAVEQELRHNLRLLRAQFEIQSQGLESTDETLLHSLIVRQALALSGGELAALYLLQEKPEGKIWDCVASETNPSGSPLPEKTYPLVLDRLPDKLIPLHILDTTLSEFKPFTPEAQAVFVIPLLGKHGLIGALYFEGKDLSTYLGENRQRLMAFTLTAAQVLSERQTYQAEKQRSIELFSLNQLSRALEEAADEHTALKVILGLGAQLLDMPYGIIIEYSELDGSVKVSEVLNLSPALEHTLIGPKTEVSSLFKKNGFEPVLLGKEDITRLGIFSTIAPEEETNIEFVGGVALPFGFNFHEYKLVLLLSDRPYYFDAHKVELLETIYRIGRTAVERINFHSKMRWHIRQLELLNKISQRLTAVLQTEDAYRLTVQALVQELGYSLAAVIVRHPFTGELLLGPFESKFKVVPPHPLPPEKGIAHLVIKSGTTYICNHCAEDPHYQPWGNFQPGSEICAPVWVEKEVRAALIIEEPFKNAFTDADRDLIESLTAQLGTTLTNASRFERILRTAQRLNSINHANQELTFCTTPAGVAEVILDTAFDLLNAKKGGVFLVKDDGTLRPLLVRGITTDIETTLRSLNLNVNTGLFGEVYRSRKLVYVANTESDPRVVQIPGYTGKSIYCFPIIASSKVIGMIDLDALPGDEEVLTLLESFFNRVGVTLENILLYDQTVQLSQQRAFLLNFAMELAALTDLPSITNKILIGAREALDANAVCLFNITENEAVIMDCLPLQIREGELELHPGITVPLDRCPIISKVLEEKRLITLSANDPELQKEHQIIPYPSMVVAPLIAGQERIAVLVWGIKSPDWVLDETKQTLLQGVINVASTALHRGILNEQLQLHANHLQNLVEERTEALKLEKERTQAVLDSAGEGIFVVSPEGEFIYCNPAFEEQVGYTLDELKGGTKWEWLKDTGEDVYRLFSQSAAQVKGWEKEIRGVRKDGNPFDAILTLTPVRDDKGNIREYVGTLQDITRLKELDRLKSQFVSNVSHELRTPLTSIRLYAEQMTKATPDRLGRYIEGLQREVLRLQTLVEDLLTISRLDLERQPRRLIPINLVQFAKLLVEDRQILAQSRGLLLEFDGQPELPPIAGDEVFLSHIIANLLTNAINYTPAGGTVRVSVKDAVDSPDYLMITIEDNGLGIPETELPYIFDRFYRGSAGRKLQVPGTGLGLSIVKEIVERLEGKIKVESQEGNGTRVSVWFPTWRKGQTRA